MPRTIRKEDCAGHFMLKKIILLKNFVMKADYVTLNNKSSFVNALFGRIFT